MVYTTQSPSFDTFASWIPGLSSNQTDSSCSGTANCNRYQIENNDPPYSASISLVATGYGASLAQSCAPRSASSFLEQAAKAIHAAASQGTRRSSATSVTAA